jgi:GrpB-like predicted nucleotidyltransferase (UPF0157 family)
VDVPAVVVTYDPGWPGLFLELRDRVDTALADVAHVTEHVGSTAVPGLDAKPIIDVDPAGQSAVCASSSSATAGTEWAGNRCPT